MISFAFRREKCSFARNRPPGTAQAQERRGGGGAAGKARNPGGWERREPTDLPALSPGARTRGRGRGARVCQGRRGQALGARRALPLVGRGAEVGRSCPGCAPRPLPGRPAPRHPLLSRVHALSPGAGARMSPGVEHCGTLALSPGAQTRGRDPRRGPHRLCLAPGREDARNAWANTTSTSPPCPWARGRAGGRAPLQICGDALPPGARTRGKAADRPPQ